MTNSTQPNAEFGRKLAEKLIILSYNTGLGLNGIQIAQGLLKGEKGVQIARNLIESQACIFVELVKVGVIGHIGDVIRVEDIRQAMIENIDSFNGLSQADQELRVKEYQEAEKISFRPNPERR